MKKSLFLLALFFTGMFFLEQKSFAAEPTMAEYTAYPVFMADSVQPNIMIILDNSGSMNFNAYGDPANNDDVVQNDVFRGEPYGDFFNVSVSSGGDDAEEKDISGSVSYTNSGDLDIGAWDVDYTQTPPVITTPNIVGVRFENIALPKGAVICSAHIVFTAYRDDTVASDFEIFGEDIDDAPVFSLVADNIKGRTYTSSVLWSAVPAWTQYNKYSTPDISSIVQTVVDRAGWVKGNAMVFKFAGTGKRDAYSRYASTSRAPVLVVEYTDAVGENKRYYGYFNPDFFYEYDSNKFVHKYKKIEYSGCPSSGSWKVAALSELNGVDNDGDGEVDENDELTVTTLSDAAIVSSKLWDGNWLNWLCMRRIDALRKVIMGGLATSRTGGGNQVNIGEKPSQTSRTFTKVFDSSIGSAASPYDGVYSYTMDKDANINVDGDTYHIKIQKDINYEPSEFKDGNISGVLQKVGDKARWGNMFYKNGSGNNGSGGSVKHTIGTNMTTLITNLQLTGCDTWTPLAETMYVATQYFKQEDPESGLEYATGVAPNANTGQDPYYNSGFVHCAKSFVILLTDGASTKDGKIPDFLKDFDGDGDNTACNEDASPPSNCDYGSGGTDYLDDVALYARTTDLRSSTVGKTELEGDQNIILYTVYAFGNDDDARNLLKDAARNGGFKDRNGNNRPDGTYASAAEDRLEWDEDGDNIPDTYYEADDGYILEKKLLEAITSILNRAASGTSASVLATNSEGEGNMVQAYFRPSVTEGITDAKWRGFLHSLWVDPWGNLREDSNGNHKLDLVNTADSSVRAEADMIISYKRDEASNDTKIVRYTTHYRYDPRNTDNQECILGTLTPAGVCTTIYETLELEEIDPVFEAGSVLADRDPATRKIFTYVDKDSDGLVDEVSYNHLDSTDEAVVFNTASSSVLNSYFGVADVSTWDWLGATGGTTRADNLINYIRGTDSIALRNRTLSGETWKLGDIINSTPVTVSRPAENYHIIYKDESYQTFYNEFKDRETVIYVGANDGMLHAFTSWKYNKSTGGYENPYPSDTSGDSSYIANEEIGDELWAYIPQSVLPHLKWYAYPGYTHTYYVDLMPKVADVKIFADDTHYTDADTDLNWGTILLVGLNMGGKEIVADGTKTFYPSYACLDVTEPRSPKLLWERAYTNLAMSRSVPAIVRVEDEWFAVFGSGPTEYDGTSANDAYVFVVNLKTGEPYKKAGAAADEHWLFGPLESKAFINSPVALDKSLNNNVDAIYFGETYETPSGAEKGRGHKITIPCTTCNWNSGFTGNVVYDDTTADWESHVFFDTDRPVTAPMSLSVDRHNNAWIFFGTGRYIGDADKTDNSQQYFYGVKDPFFNQDQSSYYHDFTTSLTLDRGDLFNANGIQVTTSKRVLDSSGSDYGTNGTWADLLTDAQNADGWYISLAATSPSERVVSKPAVLGGTVFVPSFTPSADVCGFGGDANFYALYYETGTGYFKQSLRPSTPVTVSVDVGSGITETQEVVAIKRGTSITGAPPPRIGLHVGKQDGAKGFLQQSTGEVVEIEVDTALNVKSGLTNWRQK